MFGLKTGEGRRIQGRNEEDFLTFFPRVKKRNCPSVFLSLSLLWKSNRAFSCVGARSMYRIFRCWAKAILRPRWRNEEGGWFSDAGDRVNNRRRRLLPEAHLTSRPLGFDLTKSTPCAGSPPCDYFWKIEGKSPQVPSRETKPPFGTKSKGSSRAIWRL